jgi:tetratricopeptide (TPR) repeat protein
VQEEDHVAAAIGAKPRLLRDMGPPASIIVPTRQRAEYLDVALASIAPQAAAAGAELLVVDDGPDERTRTVALRHGARYLAHDASRGLNAARNSALDAAAADLLVFVDDDVEVRPGWLGALLGADAAAEVLHRALALDPLHADAHVNLGRLLQLDGRIEEAIEHYRAALRDGSTDPTAAFNLGTALETLGRAAESIEAYRQALALDQEFADAHFNLSRLYEVTGSPLAAIRHLRIYEQLQNRC